MNPRDEASVAGRPHVHLLGVASAPAAAVPDPRGTRAIAVAEILGNAADELKDCCDGHRGMEELIQILEQVSHVAGALGTVYDHLAEWLYADGCPARHATDTFLRTADDLRMAGASCRYAHSVFTETLNQP